MQVALVKLTAQRTASGLAGRKAEILEFLPEGPDAYFEALAEILAPEELENATG